MKELYIHNGNFFVSKNMVNKGLLTDNAPAIVLKNFSCRDKGLTSLKNVPKEVYGYFSCSNNYLTNLEFSPELVTGSYFCNNNKLTTLKGCTEKINKMFDCSRNMLTSLEFAPKTVCRNINHYNNKNNLSIESKLIRKGYTNYYPDLLSYCIDNSIDLESIETWPEGFLTEHIKQSSKGLTKFSL